MLSTCGENTAEVRPSLIICASRLDGSNFMKTDCSAHRFLRLARKAAFRSRERHRHGAVLVKSGRVLSIGFNYNNKTNYLTKKYFLYPTVHAEMDCFLGLSPEDIKDSVLYVYRVKRLGDVGYSAPCAGCSSAIRDLRIKRVIYSTEVEPYFSVQTFG